MSRIFQPARVIGGDGPFTQTGPRRFYSTSCTKLAHCRPTRSWSAIRTSTGRLRTPRVHICLASYGFGFHSIAADSLAELGSCRSNTLGTTRFPVRFLPTPRSPLSAFHAVRPAVAKSTRSTLAPIAENQRTRPHAEARCAGLRNERHGASTSSANRTTTCVAGRRLPGCPRDVERVSRNLGLDVIEAASSFEALQRAADDRPDIILMDLAPVDGRLGSDSPSQG